MASISAEEAAQQLLSCCLAGESWPDQLLDRLLEPDAGRVLFTTVVERLADLFEPRLCDVYARLFAQVLARVDPSLDARQLLDRYQRVRQPCRFAGDPLAIRNIFVLSRVTLGADVAVTSVVLNAAKSLFPNALIYFAGPAKNWELFAADPALKHLPVSYRRAGSLAERLAVWPRLQQALDVPDSLVIDPDSRLTQLGLLPVCAEENYFFFESRSYGGETPAPLPELTSRWLLETFGVAASVPFIAPLEAAGNPADFTVSFGVGESQAKRVAGPFETDLLRYLSEHESSVLIDRGAGGEEAGRVERAVAQSGGKIRMWDGSFAGFAAQIARSSLYIGYDSAGGHVAAASAVPLISIFGGFASERMFQRWRPSGPGPIHIVRVADPVPTLAAVTNTVNVILHGHKTQS